MSIKEMKELWHGSLKKIWSLLGRQNKYKWNKSYQAEYDQVSNYTVQPVYVIQDPYRYQFEGWSNHEVENQIEYCLNIILIRKKGVEEEYSSSFQITP